jgi:Spy/CpxP family protein refolding chaperone
MPIRLLPALAATAALLAAGTLLAQEAPPATDQVVDLMTNQLNLTENQRRVITPAIEERRAKLKALRESEAGRRGRRAEARAVLEDSVMKINAVLTPEQQRKYKELERQMIDRMRQQRRQAQ